MELAEWIMTIFTGLIGLAAVGAAVLNVDRVFALRKLAFLERKVGRPKARWILAVFGVFLIALAVSFVAVPAT